MIQDNEIYELADQILRSYYFEPGLTRTNKNSDRMSSDVKSAPMQIIFPIFVDLPDIAIAGLMLRKMMPIQFGSISLEKAKDFILDSVNTNIAGFFDCNPPTDRTTNYLDAIGDANRTKFHLFVQRVLTDGPTTQTFSFPLSRMSVVSRYEGSSFHVIRGDDIGDMDPERIFEKIRAKQNISAWIRCTTAFAENAQKTKRIALGAMSLRLPHIERTQKTIALSANGFVTHNPLSWSSSCEHMPPISYDITIEEEDNWWLNKIDCLIKTIDKPTRRLRKATEYFYLGWFFQANERFAFNLMTLDALFGQGGGKTADKLKDGISSTLGRNLDTERIGEIVNFRAQFLHGGSPDIYDSSKYDNYIRKYKCDPIIDVEYLAASSLRRKIFGADFKMQSNPYDAKLQELKDRGVIASLPSQPTIIQES